MKTMTVPPPPNGAMNGAFRSSVVLQEEVLIPGWVNDLESYRYWAHSDDFPERGWLSYLDGRIWVDLGMEEFLTHNQVKGAFNVGIGMLLIDEPTGRFVPDRMLLTNASANLATEPDGLFFLWDTLRSGRLRMIPGKKQGYVELQGTPDMVLEVTSISSEMKDTVALKDLYWRAGIAEYWLVNAQGAIPKFDILRHTPAASGYEPAVAQDGWVASAIFGREFKLERRTDPLGHPLYVLLSRWVS